MDLSRTTSRALPLAWWADRTVAVRGNWGTSWPCSFRFRFGRTACWCGVDGLSGFRSGSCGCYGFPLAIRSHIRVSMRHSVWMLWWWCNRIGIWNSVCWANGWRTGSTHLVLAKPPRQGSRAANIHTLKSHINVFGRFVVAAARQCCTWKFLGWLAGFSSLADGLRLADYFIIAFRIRGWVSLCYQLR